MSAEKSVLDCVDAIKVSSVLNGDVKSYGKQNLTDGNPDTCWNSDKGEGQFIMLRFSAPSSLSGIELMFQGGFAPVRILVHLKDEVVAEFSPRDCNDLQHFEFPEAVHVEAKDVLQLLLPKSWDLFGRITVYSLNLY